MDKKLYAGQRCICLARVSNDADGNNSTEAQLALLHAEAKRLDMIFVEDITMEGLTGSLPGRRDDLHGLLERKRKTNDFDVLVLQRLDRLTRSGSDHGFWFEHECKCVGIQLLIVGDDIPEGRYASLIKVAKYEAAREQAYSISQRSTQGSQLAMEDGRIVTSNHTPYGCWRMYLHADGKPSHIIRDLGDGRQEKLNPETYAVIDTYGHVGGGGKGHYRKQKSEKVLLMPGDTEKVEVVREIFRLHYHSGWGGKRIADRLNSRGIRSPMNRQWSQRQVESLYEQEAYTGRSVGNRVSSSIYHERQAGAPKQIQLDESIRTTARNIPVRQRPVSEWFIQDQPLMHDYLDAELRKLARAAHEKLWERRGDPNRQKMSKSRHKASDYLLSGLLFAKQDGAPLVGVLCGRIGHRERRYRHRRGRTGYLKGSIYNRTFQAEPLERAVLETAQAILSDTPHLRERVVDYVNEQMRAMPNQPALDDLRQRREQVRKRTELIAATLDEATLADAKATIERLRVERQRLDDEIAAAEAAGALHDQDPEETVNRVIAQLAQLSTDFKTMPTFALRQTLAAIVERVVADMESKEFEIFFRLPPWAFVAQKGENAMRLVGSLASSTSYETHHDGGAVLGVADCRYIKLQRSVCFDCRRRPAA